MSTRSGSRPLALVTLDIEEFKGLARNAVLPPRYQVKARHLGDGWLELCFKIYAVTRVNGQEVIAIYEDSVTASVFLEPQRINEKKKQWKQIVEELNAKPGRYEW